MEESEELLDWLVELNVQHYVTESFVDYKPTGKSHFYLKGSQERFTSWEMIQIFIGRQSKELNSRWNNAIADVQRKSTKSS